MGRAPCCDKNSVKRGPWSPEEDDTLRTYVQTHGTGGNWIALPRKAGLSLSLPFVIPPVSFIISDFQYLLLAFVSVSCLIIYILICERLRIPFTEKGCCFLLFLA